MLHGKPVRFFQHYLALADIGMIGFAYFSAQFINGNTALLFYLTHGGHFYLFIFFYFTLWQVPFVITVDEKVVALVVLNQAAGCLDKRYLGDDRSEVFFGIIAKHIEQPAVVFDDPGINYSQVKALGIKLFIGSRALWFR